MNPDYLIKIIDGNVTLEALSKSVRARYCLRPRLDLTNYGGIIAVDNMEAGGCLDYENEKAIIHISSDYIYDVNYVESESDWRYCLNRLEHVIHHEFCHIHINNKIKEVKNFLNLHNKKGGTLAYIHSILAFDEYMASQMSRASLTVEGFKMRLLDFHDRIKMLSLPLDSEGVGRCIKDMSYFFGYSAKHPKKRDETINQIENKVIRELAEDVCDELTKLASWYPNLTGEDFHNMCVTVNNYY